MKRIEKFFYGFIPKYVPVRLYLLITDVLAFFGKMPEKESRNNMLHNILIWEKYCWDTWKDELKDYWRQVYEKKRDTLDVGSADNVIQYTEEITAEDSEKEDEEETKSYEEFERDGYLKGPYVGFIGKKQDEFFREEFEELFREKIKEEKIGTNENGDENNKKNIKQVHLNRMDYAKVKKKKLYIEKQSDLDAFVYGRQNDKLSKKYLDGQKLDASKNSCEVIAVYNAFTALDGEQNLPQLLYTFERNGIIKSGYFGTSPNSLYEWFKKCGLQVSRLLGRKINKVNIDKLEKKYDVFLMMSYNNANDIGEMVHTICITKEGDKFKAHNDYEGSRETTSLCDSVLGYNDYKSKPIMLIGLKKA